MEKQSKTLVMLIGGMMKEMFRVLKKRNAEQAEEISLLNNSDSSI